MAGLVRAAQSLVKRAVGTRGLHHAIDALQNRMEERDRAAAERIDDLLRRLDGIDDRLATQGRYDTERAEAISNTLAQIRSHLADLVGTSHDGSAARALGEVRAEISELRADLAQEADGRNRRG